MKYTRTKDGIFDETEHRHTIKNGRVSIMGIFYEFKQADTIEELCDEFVWVSVNEEYANRKANEYGLRTSKMQVNSPQIKTVYGAIWTDKGLIYVAKMNDKGELELL